MRESHNAGWRRGSAAVMAMVYLSLMSVLALAISSMASLNTQTTYNYDGIERARANAETGLRWIGWRFQRVSLPRSIVGDISKNDTEAQSLWGQIKAAVKSNLSDMGAAVVAQTAINVGTQNTDPLIIDSVYLPDGSTFKIEATPCPSDHPGKWNVILVKATGTYGKPGTSHFAKRAMTMEFLIEKTMKYGVVTHSQIQLGKNTIIEGDLYVARAPKSGQAPLQVVSDMLYTEVGVTSPPSPTLTQKVQAFQTWLATNDASHTNRVPASQLSIIRSSDSKLANIADYNSDGYIDEYDLFLQHLDTTGTDKTVRGVKDGGSLAGTEFYARAPEDSNLFYLLDGWLGEPLPNDPDPNAQPRLGYNDGVLDANDHYAKITGHVKFYETESALATRLKTDSTIKQTTPTIASMLQGPVMSPDGDAPVQFGVTSDPALDLDASDFTMGAFLNLSGTAAGSSSRPPSTPNPDAAACFANTTVTATINSSSHAVSGDANGTLDATIISRLQAGGSTLYYTTKKINGVNKSVLTGVRENVPYGSTGSPQSTFQRPVFSNVNFKNCIINRGTNALFVNCTFDGVTFVDGDKAMADSSSDTYASGNNLRFDNCTFTGPIAQGDKTGIDAQGHPAPAPSSPTLKANKWQFTGDTTIDFSRRSLDGLADTDALAKIKEQATIMAPQTSIEMGSFSTPGQAHCSFRGVAVVGNMDIRGVADIDGTIIGLFDRSSADNMTLGYFGSSDGSSNNGQADPTMVATGTAFGRIHIRYNPYRTLPDGINLTVSMLPDPTTWREVTP